MAQPLPGIRIGHWDDQRALTGCTVLLPTAGAMRAGVAVGGGAPGTRETDLLAPTSAIAEIHALLLTGGSAFGLDAAGGVMRYLRERGIGFDARVARVPIVPAAVIFDLDIGDAGAHPDAASGYAACAAAADHEDRQGNVGAGCGARVGNLLGPAHRTKGGLGLAVSGPDDRVAMGVLAVVNAAGDILNRDGSILAGVRDPGSSHQTGAVPSPGNPGEAATLPGPDGPADSVLPHPGGLGDAAVPGPPGFADAAALLRRGMVHSPFPSGPLANTTLVAVVTEALLDKTALTRLAQQAHDGLARAISPVHTRFDGDTAFALSTGGVAADPDMLAALAVELVAEAIRNAVRAARGVPGAPAIVDR